MSALEKLEKIIGPLSMPEKVPNTTDISQLQAYIDRLKQEKRTHQRYGFAYATPALLSLGALLVNPFIFHEPAFAAYGEAILASLTVGPSIYHGIALFAGEDRATEVGRRIQGSRRRR